MAKDIDGSTAGRNLHWVPIYHRDLKASTADWSDSEFGAYLRLLLHQWDRGSIPSDMARLARIAPSAAEHWELIGPKFPGGVNPRMAKVRSDRDAVMEARQEAARAANNARWRGDKKGGGGGSKMRDGVRDGIRDALRDGVRDGSRTESVTDRRSESESESDTETEPKTAHAARASAPTRLRRSEPDAIRWEPESGWSGITDADRKAWAVAYPACDLTRQLAAMDQWLRANPAKARRSAWRRFVTSWLSRSQDRGGDTPSAPRNGTLNHADPVARRAAQREREFPEPTPIIVPRINP